MTKLKFAALAAAVLLAPAAFAADDKKVENPEFKTWSKFKADTKVVLKMSSDAGGMKFETTVTNKLVEVKDDKVVVETESSTKINGTDFNQPAQKRDVPKEVEKDKLPKGVDPKSDKPEGTTEEGKEKLKVGGTEYECKWYKFKSKQKLPTGDEEVEGQIWMSDDVPGKLVKMTTKAKAGSMSMEVTEVTIKK
jgi:hypothetical protein